MDKPTPKKEIDVKLCDDCLLIDCMSADASEWVEDNARGFGRLFQIGSFTGTRRYTLYVNSNVWNVSEVAAWIEKMGVET